MANNIKEDNAHNAHRLMMGWWCFIQNCSITLYVFARRRLTLLKKNACTFFGFGFMLYHHMLKDRYIADVVIHYYDSISIQLCLKAGEYPPNGHFTKGYMMIIKRLTSQPAGLGDTHFWRRNMFGRFRWIKWRLKTDLNKLRSAMSRQNAGESRKHWTLHAT